MGSRLPLIAAVLLFAIPLPSLSCHFLFAAASGMPLSVIS